MMLSNSSMEVKQTVHLLRSTPRRYETGGDESARLKTQLKDVQKSLRTLTSKMALQRQQTQKFIARCRLQIEQIGDRCREDQNQHDQNIRAMTSKLTLLENQVEKEKKEIRDKIAEKNRIIEEQQTHMLKLTAVNNHLAAAISRIKLQLTTADLSGRATLMPLQHAQPEFHLGEEFDVDWDISREVFDLNHKKSPNKTLSPSSSPSESKTRSTSITSEKKTLSTLSYGSEENVHVGRRGSYDRSSLSRSRSMPVLDDDGDSVNSSSTANAGSVDCLSERYTSTLEVSIVSRAQSVDALDATSASQKKSRHMFKSHENLSTTRMPLSLPRKESVKNGKFKSYLTPGIPSDLSLAEKKERAKGKFLKPKDIKKRHRDKSMPQPAQQAGNTPSKSKSVFKIFSFAF